MTMLQFLAYVGVACVAASLALAAVAWFGRCACAQCRRPKESDIRITLERPALSSASVDLQTLIDSMGKRRSLYRRLVR